jgi:hypothetical protein
MQAWSSFIVEQAFSRFFICYNLTVMDNVKKDLAVLGRIAGGNRGIPCRIAPAAG